MDGTPDALPAEPEALSDLAFALGLQATVYGLPAVVQYAHLCAETVPAPGAPVVVNRLVHGRELAGPGYAVFGSPNSDTLYSNCLLDLSAGPVVLELPDFAGRYFTVNFLDAWGNATNISRSTSGREAGRYLLYATDEPGCVVEGATPFRVATDLSWILLRIFAAGPDDLAAACALQDGVTLAPVGPGAVRAADHPVVSPETVRTDAFAFFATLDHLIRRNGHPRQEDALLFGWRVLGIGVPTSAFDPDVLAPAAREGLARGFAAGYRVAAATLANKGQAVSGGAWRRSDCGAWGFNYNLRAAQNIMGQGATVVQENQSFVAFVDGDLRELTGEAGAYLLRFEPPPPVSAFWSVSAYDRRTGEYCANPLGRYSINSASPGLGRGDDGSVHLVISHDAPPGEAAGANWLPCPPGRFYLVIRAYQPDEAVISGDWEPPPLRRTGSIGPEQARVAAAPGRP
ncbi:DUF1254 domain-containing protein [Pseudonocardia ailaonensis]|uniref:DUF1254 domain-containing protein n=1 Tax=Pseudonocardia ailaonensis TaxID=367279 RepID=UPI0031DDA64D